VGGTTAKKSAFKKRGGLWDQRGGGSGIPLSVCSSHSYEGTKSAKKSSKKSRTISKENAKERGAVYLSDPIVCWESPIKGSS